MSVISELVQEELINLNNSSSDVSHFFKETSSKLESLGYVKSTFFKAVSEREKKYPTGLELPNIVIAIPHTDVEHIVKPFIYINRINSQSLEFIQMGTDDEMIKPEYVIVLGIKEPTEQVTLLSTMIELFNDEEFVEKLNEAEEEQEIYNLLNKN